MKFQREFFKKQSFTPEQLERFFQAAEEDLKIAAETTYNQVRFRFSYDAMLKLGIALVARQGYKVRSVAGHHAKLLQALGELLNDPDIENVADIMRQKRNMDLYEGGTLISEKECQEYLEYVMEMFQKAGRPG